ncbi:VCBS repeat-containing protein [bacterium]|nr:VCBS repeat-containing protein [bacterium]
MKYFVIVVVIYLGFLHPQLAHSFFIDHNPQGTFGGLMCNWVDFDQDGDLDFIGTRLGAVPSLDSVGVAWNNLPGEWTYETLWGPPVGNVRVEGAQAYDFDQDGDYDILVLLRELSDYALILLEQTAPLEFTYHFISDVEEYQITPGLQGTGEFHIADIDNDGTLDFICYDEVWFDMVSDGRIVTSILVDDWGNGEITYPADIDGDTDLDFFTINYNSKIMLFKYDENHEFTSERLDDEESINPYKSIISGDYDTDGDIDALVFREETIDPPFLPDEPLLFRNDSGLFVLEEPFAMDQWHPLGILDGNNDGVNDLLVRNHTDGGYSSLLVNDAFGGVVEYFVDESYNSKPLLSKDIDHDGDLDILRFQSSWFENLLYDEGPIEMDVRWDPDVSPTDDQLIEFDFILANYNQIRTGWIWIDAVTPTSTLRLHTYHPTMHPGQFMVLRNVQQQVPQDLPAGDYEYRISVGIPPNNVMDSDTLFFHSYGATANPVLVSPEGHGGIQLWPTMKLRGIAKR